MLIIPAWLAVACLIPPAFVAGYWIAAERHAFRYRRWRRYW